MLLFVWLEDSIFVVETCSVLLLYTTPSWPVASTTKGYEVVSKVKMYDMWIVALFEYKIITLLATGKRGKCTHVCMKFNQAKSQIKCGVSSKLREFSGFCIKQ